MTSLSASLQQKISATTDRLCQIALNQSLSRKFEKWRKFSSHIKVKSIKKKSHKTRPACMYVCVCVCVCVCVRVCLCVCVYEQDMF